VFLAAVTIARIRRGRQERQERLEDRRLILQALIHPDTQTGDAETAAATKVAAIGQHPLGGQLDPRTVSELLELLDRRQPRGRGVIAGLFASPLTAWHAGTRAGQRLSRPSTVREREHEAGPGRHYRDAAAELVTIYSHDRADAVSQYHAYAAAVGSDDLAELYLRSAAYNALADRAAVDALIEDLAAAVPASESMR
jgi:hypothetical protein